MNNPLTNSTNPTVNVTTQDIDDIASRVAQNLMSAGLVPLAPAPLPPFPTVATTAMAPVAVGGPVYRDYQDYQDFQDFQVVMPPRRPVTLARLPPQPQYLPEPRYPVTLIPFPAQHPCPAPAPPPVTKRPPAPPPVKRPPVTKRPPAPPPPVKRPPAPPPPPPGGPPARKWVTFRAGDPALKAKGSKTAPVVTKEGRTAWEVTYRKGTRGGGDGSNMNTTLAPAAFFPSNQVRMKFKIMFSPGFPWDPKVIEKSGGKIIGFSIGTGDASGGNFSTTGASYRITWTWNGGVMPYLYPQVRSDYRKGGGSNADWKMLDQSEELERVSHVASGVHVFFPGYSKVKDPSTWTQRMREGVWNDVDMFIKLNTPGKKDGVLELTVNGVTKRLDTVRYRYDSAPINGVKINTFFGGGTMNYAPPFDCKTWYADFAFSKT